MSKRVGNGWPVGISPADIGQFDPATAQAIARYLAPAARFVSCNERRASWIGGTPALPVDVSWPRRPSGALSFLLQVATRELPASVADELPKSAAALWIFWEPAAGMQDCAVVAAAADLQPMAPKSASEADVVLPRRTVCFVPEMCLPHKFSKEIEPLLADPDARARYVEFSNTVTALSGLRVDEEGPETMTIHRLLGHADLIQSDERPDATWRLLVQVSSDPELDLEWGDWGKLYVWIRTEDLRTGRFDRVYGEIQSG